MLKVICGIEIAEECWLAKWASNPDPNPKPFRKFNSANYFPHSAIPQITNVSEEEEDFA